MTDQQQHLSELIEQRNMIAKQLENLQEEGSRIRELFLKTQGAIEYLEATGVELPEPEPTEEEAPAEEAPAEEG